MANSKFKKGDEVYFLIERIAVGYKIVDWSEVKDGKEVARGRVVDYLCQHDLTTIPATICTVYLVEVVEPYGLYGSGWLRETSLRQDAGVIVEPKISRTLTSVPTKPTDKEKMMKFFSAPSQNELGQSCPICGTRTKPLGSSYYCPNDCDRAR